MPVAQVLSAAQVSSLGEALLGFASAPTAGATADPSSPSSGGPRVRLAQKGFFVVELGEGNAAAVLPLATGLPLLVKAAAMSSSTSSSTYALGFIDPSCDPDHCGWPLRNALLLLAAAGVPSGSTVRVLAWRDTQSLAAAAMTMSSLAALSPAGSGGAAAAAGAGAVVGSVAGNPASSLLTHSRMAAVRLTVDAALGASLAAAAGPLRARIASPSSSSSSPATSTATSPSVPKLDIVGWERDDQGKLLPRRIDLSALLNPVKVMENSVDLNLKLMRWRVLPGLDVDRLHATK